MALVYQRTTPRVSIQYSSSTQNSYNLIAMNNCMGKAVVVEGGTGNTVINNKWNATSDLQDLQSEVTTHMAETASDTKLGHVLADKYVKLWEGTVAVTGEITLLSTMHNIYNAFLLQSGAGVTIFNYLAENPAGDKIQFNGGAYALCYQVYGGSTGRIMGINGSDGTRVNLTETGNQPLRAIYGIIRGTVVR